MLPSAESNEMTGPGRLLPQVCETRAVSPFAADAQL